MKKYRVHINQEKLQELKERIKPGKSYWALFGIIVFFFLPEFIAYFWGDSIKAFFQAKEAISVGFNKILYKELESLGENSTFNIILGVVFTIWFFKERFKKTF